MEDKQTDVTMNDYKGYVALHSTVYNYNHADLCLMTKDTICESLVWK